jgi:diacylglycerol kinase family enzyme
LKFRWGPLAYFVSGMRALKAPRACISLVVDGRPTSPRRVRTVVVGNCGKLLAGLVLMPTAKVDDGLLDVVSIDPKGLIGWLAVTARVLARRRHGHEECSTGKVTPSSSAQNPPNTPNSTATQSANSKDCACESTQAPC